MRLRRSLAAVATCAALISCGTKPYSTAYNLDFEYGSGSDRPTCWLTPDKRLSGYTVRLDRAQFRHGSASLRMEQTDPGRMEWGSFGQSLQPALAAGREVELSGWVRTEEVQGGFADFFLTEGEPDAATFAPDTARRGLRNTTQWTRLSVKKRIAPDARTVQLGGMLKGSGRAWFDRMEVRIDGVALPDTLIAAPKTRLSHAEKKELLKYVYPLRTYDPDAKNTDDLRILDSLIGRSRIAALGENSHGSSEIYRMKERLVRYLVENLGFDLFALEAGMPESQRMNAYIAEGKGYPAMLLAGLRLWPWYTHEMLSLVQWMREYEQSGRKLAFTGVDMQSYEGAVGRLEAAFEGDAKALGTLREMRAGLKKALTYSGFAPRVDPQLAAAIRQKSAQIEERIGALPADEREKAQLRQYAMLLRQYLGQGGHAWWRDCCMARNLLWIARQNPASRIVAWAHNGHIEKKATRMGGFLADSLGAEYVNFGFTFYKGSYTGIGPTQGKWVQQAQKARPGTVEYLLGQLGEPLLILDMKRMRAEGSPALGWLGGLRIRHVGAVKLEDEFWDDEPTDKFDYLVFLRKSSPSHLLSDE